MQDVDLLAELRSCFERSLRNQPEALRLKIERLLRQGWQPAVFFRVAGNGAAQLEVRLQDASGVKYLQLRYIAQRLPSRIPAA